MKLRRLVFIEFLFFSCIPIFNQIFRDARMIKISLYLLLILVLTFCIHKYIFQAIDSKLAYVNSLISLFMIFEVTKFVSSEIGILPRYSDVSWWFSAILYLIAIAAYLFGIVLLVRLSKVRKNDSL